MKFIHSIAHQLSLAEDRIKALEKEKDELRSEPARSTGRPPRRRMAGLPTSPTRNRLATSEPMLPSYARSTMASRLRSSPSSAFSSGSTSPSTGRPSSPPTSPKRVSINGKNCGYKDGALEVMRYGYLEHTFTTGRRHEEARWARMLLRPPRPNLEDTAEGPCWANCKPQSHDVDSSDERTKFSEYQPEKTPRIISQTEWDDLVSQKAIAIRTRLADRAWTIGSRYNVYIDHDSLFYILSGAETLAKSCLWEWMRTHRPGECRRWFPYRSDVDFGREPLTLLLQCLPCGTFNYRHTQSWQVTRILDSLICMRNLLHHFSGGQKDVRRMDGYLETVQELAVLFYDEEAARSARTLRDKLREEAERTLQEIETTMMLTSLPYHIAVPWKPHHVDLVQNAASQLDGRNEMYIYPEYTPIAYAAAREWVPHRRGWNYGVSLPEVEAKTKPGDGESQGPGLENKTDSDRETSIAVSTKAMHSTRRLTFSADMGVMKIVDGGQEGIGDRRRAVSMSQWV